jgi:penicillin-binding protein 1B
MSRYRIIMALRGRQRPATRRRRAGGGLRRTAVCLGVVALVASAIGLLYLNVALTRRFEGRLWSLPARVYSDVLLLGPGSALRAEDLSGRLDRSGYARTAGEPQRPGQYRQRGEGLDVHLRAFDAAGVRAGARRLRFRFGLGRLRSIQDERGRQVHEVAVEPELLATLYGPRQEERRPVRLDAVPERLRQAVLAAEDARFFEHRGLDLRGILRASFANLRQGKIVQGGSTITQQTVKNLFLDHRRSWWRKGRESVLSVLLDARYSKERIFEVYLNEVYLGQRGAVAICGVQAASRFYFGRDIEQLSLGESALLAGLIRSPGRYNPFAQPDKALERRDLVLAAMERLEHVDAGAAAAARNEPLVLASGAGGFASAPYAVDFVRTQIAELVSPETLRWEGLSVHTTIDTVWQLHAQEALRVGLERLERERGTRVALQGAVIVLEPQDGAILAMVGGRDYTASQFNRAAQARRQPGSCFKPFVYAAGFERAAHGDAGGLTPATLLDDSPLEMRSGGQLWRPANYDGQHRGWVTVRTALEQSLNVPTVRAATQVGLARVAALARRLGIESQLSPVPSLALGAIEVTPLELASAYATLARQGRAVHPWVVREIVDAEGRTVLRPQVAWTQAMSPQSAHLVTHLLQGVLREGTARSAAELGYDGEASGKTGTTDDLRDAWFVGYTADLLSLVWVGSDDNRKTGLTGTSGALPIWVDLVRRGGAADRFARPTVPDGIVERRIDPETGALSHVGCPSSIDEHFIAGTEPRQPCEVHGTRFRRWFHRLRDRGTPPRPDVI